MAPDQDLGHKLRLGHEHDKQHAQHNRDDHDHPVPVPTLLLNADIKG